MTKGTFPCKPDPPANFVRVIVTKFFPAFGWFSEHVTVVEYGVCHGQSRKTAGKQPKRTTMHLSPGVLAS